MKTPEEYLQLIDEKFIEAKAKRISRYDLEWGSWSKEMNTETRRRMDPESMWLVKVFEYWVTSSILLELYHTGKHRFRRGRVRQLKKELKDIKQVILKREILPGMNEANFQTIVNATLRGDS